MNNYLDLLPDELIKIIISHLAVNVPETLNIFDVSYFQYVNKMNTKELVVYCKDNKIKQSRYQVTNQYVKRLNIIEKYLGRILNRDEEKCVVFTRGHPSGL